MSKTHGGGLYFIAQANDARELENLSYQAYGANGRVNLMLVPVPESADYPGFRLNVEGASFFDLAKSLSYDPTAIVDRDGLQSAPDVRFYDRIVAVKPDDHETQSDGILVDIADAMTIGDTGANTNLEAVPAAYTYFGQFIAHDLSDMEITFDDTGQTIILNNGFSPFLDFGTLFGLINGHAGEETAWKEKAGSYLGVARSQLAKYFRDLPREVSGKTAVRDSRSDANLAISQMHVLMVQFHQNMSDGVPMQGTQKCIEASSKFLQSVVLFDYLPRIIKKEVYDDVMEQGRRVVAADSRHGSSFLVPIEFSAACFRFGHSMVAGDYHPWNDKAKAADLDAMLHYCYHAPSPSSAEYNLDGLGVWPRSVPQSWATDWRTMVETPNEPTPPIMALPINTDLVDQFKALPERLLPANEQGVQQQFSLPKKTLDRGKLLELPTAQVLQDHVAQKVSGTSSQGTLGSLLSPEQIAGPLNSSVGHSTPLWFYTLREAEFESGKLGDLCGRIVMETLHAAIELATPSIIKRSGEDLPYVPNDIERRTLLDVIEIAFPKD